MLKFQNFLIFLLFNHFAGAKNGECQTEYEWRNDQWKIPIISEERYENLKSSDDEELSVIQVFRSKTEAHRRFSDSVTESLKFAKSILSDISEPRVAFYKVDCEVSSVKERCINQDEFEVLFGIRKMLTYEWENYHVVHSARDIEDEIQKQKKLKDFYLCYGHQYHFLGCSFCYLLGNLLKKKKSTVGTFAVNNLRQVDEIAVHFNINLGQGNLLPMFGLWYFNCSAMDSLKNARNCEIHTYKGDSDIRNIESFVRCLNFPSVVEIGSSAKIKKNLNDTACRQGFYFYKSRQSEENKAKAFREAEMIANGSRGMMVVLLVDLDEVTENVFFGNLRKDLPTFAVKLGKQDELISEENGDSWNHISVEDTKSRIDNSLKKHFDLTSLYDATVEDVWNNGNDSRNQDDEVEIMLHSLRNDSCLHCPVDHKLALKLNDTSLAEALKQNAVFAVLFWLNVDTTSRAVVHITINASAMLADVERMNKMGTLACHDWPDICNKYHVYTWPKLFLFNKAEVYKEYKGVWDAVCVANWVKMFLELPVRRLKSAEEIELFSEGKGLGLVTPGTVAPAVTLVVLESLTDGSHAAKVISAVADKLHGQYFVGVAEGKIGKKWAKRLYPERELPLILTFKPRDEFDPVRILSTRAGLSQNIVHQFIVKSSRPTLVEMTETNFPSLYRLEKPFLLGVGITSTTELFKLLGIAAMDEAVSSLVSVAYLERNHSKNLTTTILKLLRLIPKDLPLLILLDFNKKRTLHLYRNLSRASADSIKVWVQSVAAEKEKPSVCLEKKDLKTHPLMYDYKGFIYGEDSKREAEWLLEKRKMLDSEGKKPSVDGKLSEIKEITHDEF